MWITLGCSLAVQAAVAFSYKFIEPNHGKDWRVHLIYFATAICSLAFIPRSVASYVFTELTVAFVGYVKLNIIRFVLNLGSMLNLLSVISLRQCKRYAIAAVFTLSTGPQRPYVRRMRMTTRNGSNIG